MAYISPEACESGLRLKTSDCEVSVTFTQRVPTRAVQQKMAGPALVPKSGGSRVLNPRMDTQEQDLQNSQSIEAGDTRIFAVAQYSYVLSNVFSHLLQNALNIAFVLNII